MIIKTPLAPLALVLAFTFNSTAATTRYVNVSNAAPASPYTNWATAATDIQSAIDVAADADLILVTNGIYQTGGRVSIDATTNRVTVDKPLMVQSVNGADYTTILGYQVPGTTNGDSAIRCVYLTNGAALSGFTLSRGAADGGAGVWCESTNAWIYNCTLTNNSGRYRGGAYGGTLTNCTLTGNTAYSGYGGGAWGSTLIHCTLTGNFAAHGGGGVNSCTLNDCLLSGNSSAWGGGALECTLDHCLLTNNYAFGTEYYDGGGASLCVLNDCTLTGNSAQGFGGGSERCTLYNCVLADNHADSGGGAYGSQLTNCTMLANSAISDGGGAENSTLDNCTLSGNSAFNGGGAHASILFNCTLTTNMASSDGGGSCSGELNYCILSGNTASTNGGGAASATLNNCTLTGNSALRGNGGGVYDSRSVNHCALKGNSAIAGGGCFYAEANSCLLIANSAEIGGGTLSCALTNCTLLANTADIGGGDIDSWLFNCVVYFNTATNGANYYNENPFGVFNYCCTTPLPTNGLGNITNAPLFVDLAGGDLRLQSNSPCINAGTNAYAHDPTDLDGNPRIVGGTVDIGAYECQSPALLGCFTWLQSYGLPTYAATVYTDSDGDRLNNWQEWRASTVPTNAASVLKMLASFPGATGATASWQSVSGVTYFLERSAALSAQPAFSAVASNLVGQAGTTTHTDTGATGPGAFFYRVGVQ
jgi:hypothetical protein